MPVIVAQMPPDAITLRARLDGFPGVERDVVVRSDQTLVDLHQVLQEAFDWDDNHLYSFWLDGEFWGSAESEYTAPTEIEPGEKSADVELAGLGLLPDATIAYIFDFGDEWKVLLTVLSTAPADEGPYPRIVASCGEAPPQYEEEEEDEEPETE
jgi:shikimate kinase